MGEEEQGEMQIHLSSVPVLHQTHPQKPISPSLEHVPIQQPLSQRPNPQKLLRIVRVNRGARREHVY